MQSAFDAIVTGRVQMVMFRDFTRRKAKGLGIAGEVENLADGTVRVRAEGEKEKLEQLIVHLKKGPLLARVRGIEQQWVEPSGQYQGFTIRYT